MEAAAQGEESSGASAMAIYMRAPALAFHQASLDKWVVQLPALDKTFLIGSNARPLDELEMQIRQAVVKRKTGTRQRLKIRPTEPNEMRMATPLCVTGCRRLRDRKDQFAQGTSSLSASAGR